MARPADARGTVPAARVAAAPELKPAPAIVPAPKPALAAPIAPIAPIASALPGAKPVPPAGGRGTAVPIPNTAGPVGSPTWESAEDEPAVIDADEALPETPAAAVQANDAEAVDAYGTPLELVAALRGQPAGLEEQIDEEEDLDDEADPAFATEELEDEEADLGDDEELDLEDAPMAAQAPIALVEDADELGLDDDDDDDLATDAADDEADEHVPEILGADFDDDELGDDDEPEAPGTFEAPQPRAEREVVLQPVQNSLFDSPAPQAAVPVTAAAVPAPLTSAPPTPTPAKAKRGAPAGERTVVLDPQAAPQAQAPQGDADLEGSDLVYRCGMLFLQHKRVAVSMLQREFGLDFKQATAILDQLQEQGLIGPYLGGQRRDILLSAEEWRAKVGAAS